MSDSNIRQVFAIARRRFLRRLEQGPATFTEAIRGLELPEGKDGRLFGAMVAELHRDGIIRPVGYVPSSNRCCHSRLWKLVDNTKGGDDA
ncbi:hypothetical protein [Rhodopirellula sp. P2]|uniref:hypothetical protein n=1 Tax=Rhodopirellula sp. P2 TaxID=2127060 RepID=UPI0023685924|nr:hypothetical protein [Rhodopirellula sp. P2]WDQ19011.1 hypothetical protein PSR62_10845 [Rhodopirellula sp. P2]